MEEVYSWLGLEKRVEGPLVPIKISNLRLSLGFLKRKVVLAS